MPETPLGEHDALGEDDGAVEDPVPVGVLESTDPMGGRLELLLRRLVGPRRLGHIEPAAVVETGADGPRHQIAAGNEVDGEPVGHGGPEPVDLNIGCGGHTGRQAGHACHEESPGNGHEENLPGRGVEGHVGLTRNPDSPGAHRPRAVGPPHPVMQETESAIRRFLRLRILRCRCIDRPFHSSLSPLFRPPCLVVAA